MIEAYPLQWPVAWPRTHYPEYSRFGDHSIYFSQRFLISELDRLGATDIVISSNLQRNQDGSISSRPQRLADTGVAVYFKLSGEERCIPSDKYIRAEDNLWAIALTVQALRGLERWGTGQIMQAAFRGFKALPESIIMGEHTSRAWWEVLQVAETADWEVIDGAYKRLLHKVHPDKGGSDFEFEELQTAYKQAKELRQSSQTA